MSEEAVAVLQVPTGEPLIYDMDKGSRIVDSCLLTEPLQMRKT